MLSSDDGGRRYKWRPAQRKREYEAIGSKSGEVWIRGTAPSRPEESGQPVRVGLRQEWKVGRRSNGSSSRVPRRASLLRMRKRKALIRSVLGLYDGKLMEEM